jgi:dihydropteroate synthase
LAIVGWPWPWQERTRVMGIVNADPDSFSGDAITTAEQAQWLAVEMVAAGADVIDVGGESTRPGAGPVSPDEQVRRVVPLIGAIRAALDAPISIDTSSAAVARAALDAGADMVNDVRGLRADPELAALCAARHVPVVVVHNQRGRVSGGDVMSDVRAGLEESLAIAADAGVSEDRIVVDPGFGFGWTPDENLELLRRLPELVALGRPVLVGVSRKSTIGTVLGDRPVGGRLHGSVAAAVVAAMGGAALVRVHDVAPTVDALRLVDAVLGRSHRM